jgi:hypothetical protein
LTHNIFEDKLEKSDGFTKTGGPRPCGGYFWGESPVVYGQPYAKERSLKRNSNKRPPALLFGIAAIAAAISLGLAGCPSSSDPSPKVEEYKSSQGGKTYILKITDGSSYVLTITESGGASLTNRGTVGSVEGGEIVLIPDEGLPITVAVANGQMTGIAAEDGSISVTDEGGDAKTETTPGQVAPAHPLLGVWTGCIPGSFMTITVSPGNTWSGGPGSNYFSGTYALSGNTATLYSDGFSNDGSNQEVGTAALNSDGSMTIRLGDNTPVPGTYIFANNSSVSSSLSGTWRGTAQGAPMTLVVPMSSPTWTATITGVGEFIGIYIMSGSNTATMYSADFDDSAAAQKIGTGTVNSGGNTMTVTLDQNTGASGSYTLTKD